MVEKIQKTLRDSAAARWTVLVLVASMMFFAYMFVDILSPLASLLDKTLNWDQGIFGTYAAGEFLLNVFGFLILAGIILDKMGVRFTGLLSASLMVIGAAIKYWGISWTEANTVEWLNAWWPSMPGSAKLAMFGFMIFGCGCEMAGTTVSKILAKWFKGKEMALAMGLEMAIARLGVFGAMWLSPMISADFAVDGTNSVTAPLLFASALLVIGLLNFFVFTIMDKTFDSQLVAIGEATAEKDPEDEFHVSDLKQILTSKMFWIVALLCVLYYSAIFPFQKYAINMLQCDLGFTASQAGLVFFVFPLGAAAITPFLGNYLDHKGKGATMMILGAILMIACHLTFAFVVPATQSVVITYIAIILLGISFSLVPAAMWPSVPKLIDNKLLGSAYALIFWIQNIGLYAFPMIIGSVLAACNPGVTDPTKLDYTVPMCLFASLGVLALILGLYLKLLDKKGGYGLEEPNIKD